MKNTTKNNYKKYIWCLIFLILTSFVIFVFSQYKEYQFLKESFQETRIVTNLYKPGESNLKNGEISSGHRVFFLNNSKLDLVKYINNLKISINPNFSYVITKKPVSQVSIILSKSEIQKIKLSFDQFIKSKQIPSGMIPYYYEFLNNLEGKSENMQVALERINNNLTKNTPYEINVSLKTKNIFNFIYGFPKISQNFITNSDNTDQYIYEKQKVDEILFDYLSKISSTVAEEISKQNCPFRENSTINYSEYFSLVDGSQCDPEKTDQIEHPDVEIYTQDFEEGKQKFRELSLAPIGLSEGPRLRVQYIHKPGGYISPTPTP